jgi:ParB family chromosome partitioning protein
MQVVYFVGWPDGETLKIGSTGNWQSRRRALEKDAARHSMRLMPLAVVSGTRNEEMFLHRHFGEFSRVDLGREMFTAGGNRLERYLRWLRDQAFVETNGNEPEYEVTFEHWMPTDGREKDLLERWIPFGPWSHLGEREVTGDDFYTPQEIIDAARAVMGDIDLDPASHAVANTKVRARRFFSKNDDGLAQRWGGRVWLNPPFSDWPSFVAKFQSERPNVTEAAVFVASRTVNAQYFSPMLETAHGLCVLRGRLPCWGPKATPAPDSGHFVLYYGPRYESFAEHFSVLGSCFRGPASAQGMGDV